VGYIIYVRRNKQGVFVPNKEKYLNTMNLNRNDVNKFAWQLGDVLHTSSTVSANGYGYCGYEEIQLPRETRVRLIGIKQTTLNASLSKDGIGDVYIDFECVDLKNADGTPVTCGNRHAYSLLEASPAHMVCPDGSGDLGMLRDGVWYSYAQKTDIEVDYSKPWDIQRNKVIVLEEVA
tara:strand:- start:11480 stop:12010 length:531 start_codon:yes stop_codon:yes gene_type:complete